jgi:hypothetical protein
MVGEDEVREGNAPSPPDPVPFQFQNDGYTAF